MRISRNASDGFCDRNVQPRQGGAPRLFLDLMPLSQGHACSSETPSTVDMRHPQVPKWTVG